MLDINPALDEVGGTENPEEILSTVEDGKLLTKNHWFALNRVTNESGREVIMVLTSSWTGKERSFKEDKWNTINFSKWNTKVEICWATGEFIHGTQKYICKRYKLIEDKNVKYIVKEDYLQRLKEEDIEPKLMIPINDDKTKFDRHFINPDEKIFDFTNTGEEPLCVVSGRGTNFVVSPPIKPGAKISIDIKENKDGYEFGVLTAKEYFSDVDAPSFGDSRNKKRFSAKMYDCLIADVKCFNIWGTFGDCNSSAIKYDDSEKILQNSRTKQYREENRRISIHDVIDFLKVRT